MKILFLPNGSAVTVYTEALELSCLGRLDHSRASRVEPTAIGEWIADLSPVGGPVLGPYTKRSEALRAEEKWLEGNLEAAILVCRRENTN
ncbi:MAG: hypothetical protein WAO55_04550 [Candidatus Manganitrophaceae bacterium]